ncbi:MAG: hypothetical protein R3B09_06695 [Nannocystaceae bacterium]
MLPAGLADTEARLLGAWPAPLGLAFRDDETLAVAFSDGVRRRWRAADGWIVDTADEDPPRPTPPLPGAFRWCSVEDCRPEAEKPALTRGVARSAVSGSTAILDGGWRLHWDLRESRAVAGIELPDDRGPLSVADGMATALGPRWLAFWDLRRREVTAVRTNVPTLVAALSRDGSTLARATETLLELWDTRAVRRLTVAALPGPPRLVAVSPSGVRVAIAGERWLRIVDREAAPLGWYGLAVRRFEAVARDRAGRWFAGVDHAGEIDWVDPEGGPPRRFSEAPEPSGDGRGIRYLEFSPDGRRLLNGGPGSRIAVWDRDSGRMVLRVLNLVGTRSRWVRPLFTSPRHLLVSRNRGELGSARWDLDSGAFELVAFALDEEIRATDAPVPTPPTGDASGVDLFAGVARVRYGEGHELLVVPLETVDGPAHLVVDRLGAPRLVPPSAVPPGVELPETLTTRRPWRDLREAPHESLDLVTHPSAPPNPPSEPPTSGPPIDVEAPRLKIRRTVHGCAPALARPPLPLYQGAAELRPPQGVSLYPQGEALLAAAPQVTPGCGATLRRLTVTVVPDAPLASLLDQLAPESVYTRRELVDRGTHLEALVSAPWAFARPGRTSGPPAHAAANPPETYGFPPRPATVVWIRLLRAHRQVWVTVAEASPSDWPFLAPAVQASFRSLQVHRAVPGPLSTASALERFSWPWEPESLLLSSTRIDPETYIFIGVGLRADGRLGWYRDDHKKVEYGVKETSLPSMTEMLEALEAEPVWRPGDEGPGPADVLHPPKGEDPLADLGGVNPRRPFWDTAWVESSPYIKPVVAGGLRPLLRELWSLMSY